MPYKFRRLKNGKVAIYKKSGGKRVATAKNMKSARGYAYHASKGD